MEKLIESKLYRNELIPISGKLVDRYNRCLEKLGFQPSTLKSFSIDGIGWSPEIAEEKEDLQYLNNGESNPHGIIITPFQKGKPIYNPYHSFDRDMMKMVFNIHGDRINDITRDGAICMDFDQGIDAFFEPMDVLKYSKVNICFHLIDNMDKIKEEQAILVEKFQSSNNFIDESIHEKLLESAKKYGDLRGRDFNLPPIVYTPDSFYTEAYGGIFLLRDFISPIMIFKDKEAHKMAIKDTVHDILIYHISEPELIEKLRSHLIIECHLDEVVDTERYDRIKKHMFNKVLKDAKHPIDKILNDPILFKSYLNRIEIEALKKVNGVEIYLERLERSNQYKLQDMVDPDFYHALHLPHTSLKPSHQDLIWSLIVAISPLDVLFLYWYDKNQFYAIYPSWDDSFKDWVIGIIKKNI